MKTHATQLKGIVESTPWLMTLLRVVRDVGPPEAYVAAGAVRDTVWSFLTGRPVEGPSADVDVVYFDANESVDCSEHHAKELRGRMQTVTWEVTNQAWVHIWHAESEDCLHPPHASLIDGLATWPETATAVGVRLESTGALSVIAPFGLEDLFSLVLRHNPARASGAVYWERVTRKQWARRWPELKILAPATG